MVPAGFEAFRIRSANCDQVIVAMSNVFVLSSLRGHISILQ